MLTSWFVYDFDYSWPFTRGHFLVFVVSAIIGAILWWRRRRGWAVAAGIVAAWGLAGSVAMHYAVQINAPQRLATETFLPAGTGHVVDLGAGSGRGTVGLLLARPHATVTSVDLYKGYFGIDDNTPERLRMNARAAGVEDRVRVEVGDMRQLPFGDDAFDAAMSIAAIDHLRGEDLTRALREAARVVRPGGQFLVVSLNVDGWIRIAMPWAIHGGGYWSRSANRDHWRKDLGEAGFELTEIGTRPATVYIPGDETVMPAAATSRG